MKTILFVTIDPIGNRRRLLNAIASAQQAGLKVRAISIGPGSVSPFSFELDYIDVPLKSGPLKFLWFNFVLFWRIFFRKYDLIYIRGLWVLPTILLRQFFHPSKLIYDAHEYFAGLATFEHRPFVRKFWLFFERLGISDFEVITTVSEAIAQKIKKNYPASKRIEVLRNLPSYQKPKKIQDLAYQLNLSVPLILFHGYFLAQRGLQNLIRAMQQVEFANLLLVGEGPLESDLKELTRSLKLEQQIHFRSFVPQEFLIDFAAQAHVGVSLLEPQSENHQLALPNKFFEYVMSGLPVLVNDSPTLKEYVQHYDIGVTVDSSDPGAIAISIKKMLADNAQLKKWRKNSLSAAQELCWEKEAEKLVAIYNKLIKAQN